MTAGAANKDPGETEEEGEGLKRQGTFKDFGQRQRKEVAELVSSLEVGDHRRVGKVGVVLKISR